VTGLVFRYAVIGIVALVLLVALSVSVRGLIYLVAPPRDDAVYAVAPTASVTTKPMVKEVLLNTSHGLLGERPNQTHAAITLVVSRTITGEYSVVNAWSPVNDCGLTVGADRLTDCNSHAWTFAGDPVNAADPPLQRFAVRNENGALFADLTHPVDAGP
jgi:hypothetical protein